MGSFQTKMQSFKSENQPGSAGSKVGSDTRLVNDLHKNLRADLLEVAWEQFEIPHSDLVMADYQVGSGGCANVFGAELHNGVVAVKVLSRSREHFAIFRREIGILMRIRHPHVLLLLGAVTKENPMGLAIVSEMCMGGSVFHRIFQENNPEFTTRTGLVVSG